MRTWSTERFAKLGIAVQLLALIRTLAEYFRLKHVYRQALTLAAVEPFVAASLATAVCIALAVGLFFAGKYKGAIGVSVITVLMLVAYKILLVGRH